MLDLFGLKIHLYGLLIGLGVWMALEIALKSQKKADKKQLIEKAFPWILMGGLIGARAYHVIDYWSRYYSSNPVKIIYLWEGGLGIWGALAGGLLATYLFCLYQKINFLELSDSLVIGVPLAQAVGRMGNWVNGELVGKNGEPLFAYEAGLNLILFVLLIYIYKLSHGRTRGSAPTSDGKLTGTYLVGYGVIRILLEQLRPSEIIWKYSGVPVAIIFGIAGIAAGVTIIFRRRS